MNGVQIYADSEHVINQLNTLPP